MRHALGAAAALVVLLGSIAWAEGPKSGPQAGERIPGPFNPLNVTGEDAGQKRCQV
jgi:hypothetical protein